MDNREILQIAMRQSEIDNNAKPGDFTLGKNVITRSEPSPRAKKCITKTPEVNLVSYGNNVVAMTKDEYRDIVEQYLKRYEWYHCFETPNLLWLEDRLRPLGLRACFMAEYFLPDVNLLRDLPCKHDVRLMLHDDFKDLYVREWSNALCETRSELDVIGVGAYDDNELVGLAACSADAEMMWQIGADVLPAYRRQGIAKALTSRIALEILKHDKVPFYCCAWSNIPSARNAVCCGFRPAWVELTFKTREYVNELNEKDSER